MKFIIKNIYKKNKEKLYELLNKFLDGKYLIEILEKNIDEDDDKIYKKMHDYYHKKHVIKEYNNIRGKMRIKDLQYLGIKNNNQNLKYLDIGCGTGEITLSIGQYLKLKKDNIYGLDLIYPFDKDEVKNVNFNFIEYDGVNFPNFQFKFDIITIFQTLHHVRNLDAMMQFIKKISKNSSIIIIREHNATSLTDIQLIDIQHFIYGKVLPKNIYKNFDKYFYSDYKSQKEWRDIFDKNGFKIFDTKKKIISSKCDKIYYDIFIKK